MQDTEMMAIVREIDEVMESFSKSDFDIVFDFLNDEVACLTVWKQSIMESEDEITNKVVSVFKKRGYDVSYSWDYDAGTDVDRCYDLNIKVGAING